MSRKEWDIKLGDKSTWEGPREGSLDNIVNFDPALRVKLLDIIDAMENTQFISFLYSGYARVVAPFVVGVSSGGNPLMRGFQTEGNSRSGKEGGWRVFQINKMDYIENHQDHFEAWDFDFDEYYPWIFEVILML